MTLGFLVETHFQNCGLCFFEFVQQKSRVSRTVVKGINCSIFRQKVTPEKCAGSKTKPSIKCSRISRICLKGILLSLFWSQLGVTEAKVLGLDLWKIVTGVVDFSIKVCLLKVAQQQLMTLTGVLRWSNLSTDGLGR